MECSCNLHLLSIFLNGSVFYCLYSSRELVYMLEVNDDFCMLLHVHVIVRLIGTMCNYM